MQSRQHRRTSPCSPPPGPLPKVVNVASPDAPGTYAPGDVVTVSVTFDRYVMVVGTPVLHLNTGKQRPGRAVYISGSGNEVREAKKRGISEFFPIYYLQQQAQYE